MIKNKAAFPFGKTRGSDYWGDVHRAAVALVEKLGDTMTFADRDRGYDEWSKMVAALNADAEELPPT